MGQAKGWGDCSPGHPSSQRKLSLWEAGRQWLELECLSLASFSLHQPFTSPLHPAPNRAYFFPASRHHLTILEPLSLPYYQMSYIELAQVPPQVHIYREPSSTCPCVCQYHTCGRRSARVPRVLPSSELSGPGLLRVGHSAGPHPPPPPPSPVRALAGATPRNQARIKNTFARRQEFY